MLFLVVRRHEGCIPGDMVIGNQSNFFSIDNDNKYWLRTFWGQGKRLVTNGKPWGAELGHVGKVEGNFTAMLAKDGPWAWGHTVGSGAKGDTATVCQHHLKGPARCSPRQHATRNNIIRGWKRSGGESFVFGCFPPSKIQGKFNFQTQFRSSQNGERPKFNPNPINTHYLPTRIASNGDCFFFLPMPETISQSQT